MERCYVWGNLHGEEQKNTHMIMIRHAAGKQNTIQLIKKLKFKWVSLEILKFLAEQYPLFLSSYYTMLVRGKHLKPGCI